MTVKRVLGQSHALAFWDRHRYAMDELYELYLEEGDQESLEEPTPDAVIDLWNGAHREGLVRVFVQAECERDSLLDAAYSALESVFGSNSSPFRITRKGRRDPWVVRAIATPKRLKIPQRQLEITLALDSATVGTLFVFASIFTKGGRNAARIFSRCLAEVWDASQFPEEDWKSGEAILSRVPLSQHLDPETGAVDLDGVLAHLLADFSRQTDERLMALISTLRDEG